MKLAFIRIIKICLKCTLTQYEKTKKKKVNCSAGHEVLPHRAGIINRHGEQDKQGFMVAFFKSLEPLNRKIAEMQAKPIKVKLRTKRSANPDEYWDRPDRKFVTPGMETIEALAYCTLHLYTIHSKSWTYK